ncbi:SgcJ/EcaC family oxidoreductase [Paenibacillus cremeus]|uniref:SgcJ/EcaC family oxidoreductase n=1 Tax=Paenibacillus cremeus TaxID=2163881 RepID=A0A559KDT5_9BACL|nr:SgcJ/EcaC family oxidoreductase [Paenibacillus cremeus]TVY10274.1 SgcJ/EcaC family oxidoreductase [Paenibacillus cremeus]
MRAVNVPGLQLTGEEQEIVEVYRRLLEGWNVRSAEGMAEPFAEDGELIGYDGSHIVSRGEIIDHLQPIFAHHRTAAFVAKVRSVSLLGPEAAMLRAIAGMVPDGAADINPQVNTHHTMVVVKHEGEWRIALFQNTPAQFHMRPELVEQMTEELRQLIS